MRTSTSYRVYHLIPLLLAAVVGGLLYNNKTNVHEARAPLDDPGTTNPTERMEYLRMLRGDPPGREVLATAHTQIKRQLRQRQHTYRRDAGINAWENIGPDNAGGRVRAIAINPSNTNQILIGGVGGGIWESTNAGSTWSIATPPDLAYPVTSIAFDPSDDNIIYATTGEFNGSLNIPGIGLLKSIDNGNNWEVITVSSGNDFWLSKVIVNPANTDILYVCGSTGTINQGGLAGKVFRSNDAGATWQAYFISSTIHVFDIDINPADTSVLYIGTNNDVRKSSNSGTSFLSMSGLGPTSPITTLTGGMPNRCDVSICEADPDNVYVLRYLPQDVDADPQADTLHSEVWFTSDAGDHWTLLSRTTSDDSANDEEICILGRQGDYDNVVWADPDNCTRAFFGGINLWKWDNNALTRISDDDDDIGGPTGNGNNSIHADQHAIVPIPGYGPGNRRVYIGNDGGIYTTANVLTAGPNTGWASLVPGLSITQLYAVDASRTGDTIYGGSQDNSFFVNRNANSGTQDWVVTINADGGHGAIAKSNPEVIYGSTQRGIFRKSINGGDSYTTTMLNLGNTTSGDDGPLFIAPFEIAPNDDNRLFAGGHRLWRSTNAGASWTISKADSVAGRQISAIEIAPNNSSIIWVGYTNGQIWQTTNGGTAWSQVEAPAMPNVMVTDLAINPANYDIVMATLGGGYDNDVIWLTADAGTSWENRSLTFDMQVYSVIWHPENLNWVYVGSDLGIFASENSGLDWNITPLKSSHPSGTGSDGPVFTAITELVWQGDGSDTHPYYLVAATHGRGIWRTLAPVRLYFYVNQNCNPCGLGSFTQPFATFSEAVAAAGSGSEIIFLSGGTYENVPPQILLDKRIKVSLNTGASPVVLE